MNDETKEVTKWEKLPSEMRAQMLAQEQSMFFNVAKFEHAQRIADMFAKSTMVPEQFRGNVGNCMIALNYAARLNADPFMIMQTLYVVKGRPGIEGKLVKALIDQSDLFSTPLDFQWLDDKDREIAEQEVAADANRAEYGCRAYATHAASGKVLRGPKITWKLVKAEGWYGKPESKWKTIPEIMFAYRAASWFANRHCPGLKLGMMTTEEIVDAIELKPQENGSFAVHQPQPAQKEDPVAALNRKVSERTPPPPISGAPAPAPAPETAPTDPGAGPASSDPAPGENATTQALLQTFDAAVEKTGIPVSFVNGYLFEQIRDKGYKNVEEAKLAGAKDGRLGETIKEIEAYANQEASKQDGSAEQPNSKPHPIVQADGPVQEKEFLTLKSTGMQSLMNSEKFCRRLLTSGDDVTAAFALKAKKLLGAFSWDAVRKTANLTPTGAPQSLPEAPPAEKPVTPPAEPAWMTREERAELDNWIDKDTNMGWGRFMEWALATGVAVTGERDGKPFRAITAEAANKILADKAGYLKAIVKWHNEKV